MSFSFVKCVVCKPQVLPPNEGGGQDGQRNTKNDPWLVFDCLTIQIYLIWQLFNDFGIWHISAFLIFCSLMDSFGMFWSYSDPRKMQ